MGNQYNGIGLIMFGPGTRVGLPLASTLVIIVGWLLLCIFGWEVIYSNRGIAWYRKKLVRKILEYFAFYP
jgi:hypothetical protein